MAVYVPSVQDRMAEALLNVIGQANTIKAQGQQLEKTLDLEREKLGVQRDVSMAGIRTGREANMLQLIGLGMQEKGAERRAVLQSGTQFYMNRESIKGQVEIAEVNKELGIRQAELAKEATLGAATIGAEAQQNMARWANEASLSLQKLVGEQRMAEIKAGSAAEKEMALFTQTMREKSMSGLLGMRAKLLDRRSRAAVMEAGGDWESMTEPEKQSWRESQALAVDDDMVAARGALTRAPIFNESLEEMSPEDLGELATAFKNDSEYKKLTDEQQAIAIAMIRDELENKAYAAAAAKGLVPASE